MTEYETNKYQFNYFSENYKRFENDFYRFSNFNIPLTFLTDDILKHMVAKKENYFRVQATKSIDNQDHYFVFNIVPDNDNDNITKFEYLKHISQRDLVKRRNTVLW